MGNRLIFPANSSTYQSDDIEGLFWVPGILGQIGLKAPSIEQVKEYYLNENETLRLEPTDWIPCQYLPSSTILGEKYVIVYFHGNSCDLGDMVDEMKTIQENTGFHIIHFEYPGYGICGFKGQKPDPDVIDCWGRAIATFIISCGMPPDCIVPMGRSIGTGPATRLASYLNGLYGSVGGLVLHSPYLSIHAIVEDYAWKIATYLVPNFWNTELELKKMAPFNVPLLIIHGKADKVIPIKHGRRLYDGYKASNKVKLAWFPEHSEHNCYDVHDDVITPLRIFLTRVGNYKKDTPKRIVPAWGYKKPRQAKPVRHSPSLVQRAASASIPHIHDTRGGVDMNRSSIVNDDTSHSPHPPANKPTTPPGGVNSFWSRILFCDCSTSNPLFQGSSSDGSGGGLLLAVDEGFMVSEEDDDARRFSHAAAAAPHTQIKFHRT